MEDLTFEEEKQLRVAYIQTFGTDAGGRVLKDLQERCFKTDTTFVFGDPHESILNEGKRQALLHIENMASKEGAQQLEDDRQKGRR